jgi:transposase
MTRIGIDIGKATLDCAATDPLPGLPRRVPNTATGITRLLTALQTQPPELVVLEATGPYHRPLLSALVDADLPTVLANPAQVAAFRQARLGREKSDTADAKLLARFAAVHGDELPRAAAVDPLQARLRDLVAYRDDLVGEQTRLRNRIHANGYGGDAAVAAWLAEDLARVIQRLHAVETETERLLQELPEAAVLQQQCGVGPRVAAAVLAYLPRPLWGNPKAAAAYAGVHPRRDQSGQRDRSHLSKQGHAGLRRYLYMAATTALRFDPALRAFHNRLTGRGKHPASAKCAVMHKLLRQLMGRLRVYYANSVVTPDLACAA